ncbi:hypothetical protein DI09_7p70 [Mitosporidium daphniae]|uniref:Uncharacterized protein n=1 Tax=Mitosporidium daphniae TaxID=1485682 RepID=A0A098VME1_9MICR|nr:uncharacterized protein DI09_7p70 [Mitosporidium daphniae]KGG50228.1 hypothetical protein DI09_7p70 [Mitosporidium daphniae]|eukprot:XP_013236711.1 uncharacterized protein DI09_7p70 [Mitosporidium daphniae]
MPWSQKGTLHMPKSRKRHEGANPSNATSNLLVVATYSGSLYTYRVNFENGGECELIKRQQYVH